MIAPEIARGLIDRHVSTDIPDVLEVNIADCLDVLIGREQAPGEHDRARRRLRQIGSWFAGSPAAVSALIDGLSAMDPVRRNRRRAVLSAAWIDLHER